MKKSTKTLLLLGAGAFIVYKMKQSSDSKALAAASAASQTAAAQPSAVVPAGSSLSGSTLAGPTLYSRAGMGIFG